MQVTFDPHPSIPVRFSETCMNCTNPSIRGEIAPPIRAYVDKGGILIDNSTVQFFWYKMCHTKTGVIREQQLKQAQSGSSSWSRRNQGASNFYNYDYVDVLCVYVQPCSQAVGEMAWQLLQVQAVYGCDITACNCNNYAFQQSSTHDTIFSAVRMGLSCSWKQLLAVSSKLSLEYETAWK